MPLLFLALAALRHLFERIALISRYLSAVPGASRRFWWWRHLPARVSLTRACFFDAWWEEAVPLLGCQRGFLSAGLVDGDQPFDLGLWHAGHVDGHSTWGLWRWWSLSTASYIHWACSEPRRLLRPRCYPCSFNMASIWSSVLNCMPLFSSYW
jgi:hypothetical protein